MNPELFVLGLVLSVVLFGWWVASVRRDARKRGSAASEWDSGSGAAEMWTTAARCPQCHESGALLSREPGGLLHTCMSCGHTHIRQTRG